MFGDAGAVAPVAHIVLVTAASAVAVSISDKDGDNAGNRIFGACDTGRGDQRLDKTIIQVDLSTVLLS